MSRWVHRSIRLTLAALLSLVAPQTVGADSTPEDTDRSEPVPGDVVERVEPAVAPEQAYALYVPSGYTPLSRVEHETAARSRIAGIQRLWRG